MQKDMQVNVNLVGADSVSPKVKSALEKINALTSKAQQARAKLKDIAIAQNQIKGFEKLRTEAIDSARALEQARAKAKELGDLTKRTGFAVEPYKKAQIEVKRLAEEHERLMSKVKTSKDALAAKGITTDRLTSQTRALRAEQERLLKVTEKQASIDQARARADQMRSRAGSLAIGGAATLGAGVGVLGGVGSTVKAYAEAESAATALKTAMMDGSGKVSADFERVNALASSLGNKLPGTTADFQDMMTMLVRQGMPAQTILRGTGEAAAYLGVQLKMAPAQAAEFAAKMQDALRAPSDDMMGVMDVIQRTFYAGVDPSNMLQGFSKVSAGMDILRIKGVEGARVLAPLLAMADQSGLVGEASGNALRKVLQLSMDTGKTRAYGMDFTDGKGEHAGLGKMFQQLQKLKALNTERRLEAIKDIFGNDAETIQMLTLMIEKGQSGYDDMVGKLQQQADLKRRVDESLGTLSAVWEASEGTWTNLKAAFGATLAPELKAITAWLGEVTAGMQAWVAENPKAARFLAILAAVLGVLLTVGGGLAIMIGGIMLAMADLLPIAAALGIGLGPIALIILGIGAAVALVVAGFVWFREELSAAWDVFSRTWMAIGTWWREFSFVNLGHQIAQGLVQGMTAGARWIWDAATGLAGKAVDAVRAKLGIRSPSRVFAEIGGFTAAGLVMGMAQGTPAVVSTAENMARQVSAVGVPGVGSGGGAGAGAAGGFSIGQVTIVIDGASGDPAAIAKAVEDQLRKMASRSRSDAAARFYED